MKTLVGLLVLTTSLSAFAELGGRPSRPEAVRSGAKEVRQVTPSQAYTVQEIQTEEGTTIREYVLPSGNVFAVVWTGPHIPDLRSLFGAGYFDTYVKELQAGSPGRRPVKVDRADLVVESSGHTRAFHGRAYLPANVPSGFSIDDIK